MKKSRFTEVQIAYALRLVRISANVTDDFGNVTGLSGRC